MLSRVCEEFQEMQKILGYREQSPLDVELVNEFKISEEQLLRRLEALMGANGTGDPRWLAVAALTSSRGSWP
jgi:hypothetical protein